MPTDISEAKRYSNMVCSKIGVKAPDVMVGDDLQYDPFQNIISITQDALDILSEDQIKAVVAHELGHMLQARMIRRAANILTSIGVIAIGLVGASTYCMLTGNSEAAYSLFFLSLILILAGKVVGRRAWMQDINKEYDADDFACEHAGANSMISVLKQYESLWEDGTNGQERIDRMQSRLKANEN